MLGKCKYVLTETVKQTSSQKRAEVSRNIAVKPQNDKEFKQNTNVQQVIKFNRKQILNKETKKISRPVSSLVKNLSHLLGISHPMIRPSIRFDISMEAAEHNYHLIKKNNYRLDRIIRSDLGTSVTTPGSEFKPIPALKEVTG